MATSYGHKPTVTDGLIFYIDAANYKSYNSGSAPNDVVNMIDTSITGSLKFGTGYTDGVWEFDGSDDHINFTSAVSELTTLTEGTVEGWYRPVDATPPSDFYILFAFGDTDGPSHCDIRIDQTTGKMRYIAIDTSVNKVYVETDAVATTDNTWTHFAVTQTSDTNDPIIYINGKKPAQTTTISNDLTYFFGSFAGDLDNLRIGNRNVNSSGETKHFQGDIGKITVWNRALSAAEVKDNYNATKWRFGL